MFGKNIITQKIKQNYQLIDKNIQEIDQFLFQYYDLSVKMRLSRPLNPQCCQHLKTKEFVCIFPKFKQSEAYHNINHNVFNSLIEQNKLNNYEIFIIGHQFDRLNTKYGKDIDNFVDTLSYLKYCKLFITSESNWHYIALLCNCRNIIVYSSNYCNDDVLTLVGKNSMETISYNPFNNNVYITTNLLCDKTRNLIASIMEM